MWKTINYLNDSTQRKRSLALSCSKKTIYIIKSNNLKEVIVILIEIKILNRDNKNKDFFKTAKSSQEDKILKFNQYMKPDKIPCII